MNAGYRQASVRLVQRCCGGFRPQGFAGGELVGYRHLHRDAMIGSGPGGARRGCAAQSVRIGNLHLAGKLNGLLRNDGLSPNRSGCERRIIAAG